MSRRKKGYSKNTEVLKKKRLKDIKKLKQFSPYFVDLLKSHSKAGNLAKNAESSDKKGKNFK